MRKQNYYYAIVLLTIILAVIILLSGGCAAPKGEGFAIYLTKEDIPPDNMPMLSHVDIAEEPIIAIADIITYDASTHEITLTANAYERICKLEVPMNGKSFLVCVNKGPVYWGAFWNGLSSRLFNGITILLPASEVIYLTPGYPSLSLYGGEDPRYNPEIMKSLREAGKLINGSPSMASGKFAHSLKGYELYSWLEGTEWHFTLITGTNRTKTLEEIMSNNNIVSKDGWVKIHVAGTDAIKSVLSRLTQHESIFWCDELHIGQITEMNINIQLPPKQITDAIKQYAEQCGLDFTIKVH